MELSLNGLEIFIIFCGLIGAIGHIIIGSEQYAKGEIKWYFLSLFVSCVCMFTSIYLTIYWLQN